MKKSFPVFLPLLLSLIPLILLSGCFEDPSSYIDCDIDALVQAIDDANANPDATTIELSPGCVYLADQAYAGLETGLPHITTEVIIHGNGATITRPIRTVQTARYRLLYVPSSGSLTISDATLKNGYVSGPGGSVTNGYGGAILSEGVVNISDVIFEDNSATNGGGIAVYGYWSSGMVQGGEFRNNDAGWRGGAISSGGSGGLVVEGVLFEGNRATGALYISTGKGGAISNWGSLTVRSSTFVGNSAHVGAGAIQSYNPAAVAVIEGCTFYENEADYGSSVIENSGISVILTNNTISGNISEHTRNAIHNESGSLIIDSSTITGNVGFSPALTSENNDVTVINSIIANNPAGDCDPNLVLTANGNNIDSDNYCNGFMTLDPMLEPLADNGGSTLTHALDPNSPAINLGSGACPATDQRGVRRPYGSACDIGAYESEVGTSICDIQFLIDAINDANANPDPTTFELIPGCIYIVNEVYLGNQEDPVQWKSGLPVISTEVSIIGNGAVITRPLPGVVGARFRLLGVNVSGNLSLSNMTLSKGYLFGIIGAPNPVMENGGAIYNKGALVLTNIIFEGNKARVGGAVANEQQASLSVISSEFISNHGWNYGGALANNGDVYISDTMFELNDTGSQNLAANAGGAIRNLGNMDVVNSSFIRNESGHHGGAIYNRLPSSQLNITTSLFFANVTTEYGASVLHNQDGNVSILNTTISQNEASGNGNVIYNESGTLGISFSTITQNTGAGPTISSDNSNVTINNSIIAMNFGVGDCSFPGAITVTGENIGWGGSCAGFIQADPVLGPLTNNGGPTLTHALDPDSLAIDLAHGNCPATDQRGDPRPQSFFCDLGAYEAEEVETCSIIYLINAINHANSNPDPTTIELDPNCTYMVDQQYGDRKTGLPHLLTNITLLGNGATITRPGLEDQPADYRFFYVENNVPVSISDLTFTGGVVQGVGGVNNDSDSHGGAIYNRGDLALAGINFSDNHALYGGAILNTDRGSLTIMNNTFNENHAAVYGGALDLKGSGGARITGALFEGNQAEGSTSVGMGYGGAIYNNESLIIIGSTFSWNESSEGGGGIYTKRNLDLQDSTLKGNASYAAGGSALENNGGTVNLFNSTVSGNNAPAGDHYAIENRGGLIRITYSTLAENRGGNAALGGVGHQDNYQFVVTNSIIAENPPGDCGQVGVMNSMGNNLDSDSSCPGFSTAEDPYLEPLADNGGATWTHALTIDSPALNQASGEYPKTDQRGEPRPMGNACDLGAYEYDGPQPTPPPTLEIDPCLFEAIRNTNCRASDCPTADFLASLPQGDMALLIGLTTNQLHGLFELPTGEECWMMMSLLTGGDVYSCNPNIAIPPPCPTPIPMISQPGKPSSGCRENMVDPECTNSGGTMGGTTGAICVCP